jgi:MFS superfamily sulfate permease-like transporter
MRWSPRVKPEFVWKDFLASIVVFLTALPLCMGIAIASGVPVEAGLVTGIIGGCLVGFLSGSSFQVSGPAAGLSVLVLEIVQHHGMEALGVILILAGVLQMAGGFARLGQVFRAVSPAVVSAMLSGIGILIFLSQLYVMCDLAPKGSGLKNIINLPPTLMSTFTPGSANFEAALLGIIGVLTFVLWKRLPKKFQMVPGALVGVLLVTVIAALRHSDVHYVSVPANILTAIHPPSLASVSKIGFWKLCEEAFAVALIASAETLLSANAVDRLHNGRRCKYDRELVAQGIGNTLCGLLGALPMTGVIARSSVNVHAGAKTRTSAILHGLWLLLFVSFLPGLLKLVPVSALAALLLVTSVKLIDLAAIRKLWGYGYRLVGIYAVTVLCIVCTDLLTGVMVGVVLSLAKLLYTMSRLEIRRINEPNSMRITLQLQGAATFISLPQLTSALERLPANCELHISLDHLDYVDHACLELLMEWEQQHTATGGSLVIDWGELNAAFKYKTKRRRLMEAV